MADFQVALGLVAQRGSSVDDVREAAYALRNEIMRCSDRENEVDSVMNYFVQIVKEAPVVCGTSLLKVLDQVAKSGDDLPVYGRSLGRCLYSLVRRAVPLPRTAAKARLCGIIVVLIQSWVQRGLVAEYQAQNAIKFLDTYVSEYEKTSTSKASEAAALQPDSSLATQSTTVASEAVKKDKHSRDVESIIEESRRFQKVKRLEGSLRHAGEGPFDEFDEIYDIAMSTQRDDEAAMVDIGFGYEPIPHEFPNVFASQNVSDSTISHHVYIWDLSCALIPFDSKMHPCSCLSLSKSSNEESRILGDRLEQLVMELADEKLQFQTVKEFEQSHIGFLGAYSNDDTAVLEWEVDKYASLTEKQREVLKAAYSNTASLYQTSSFNKLLPSLDAQRIELITRANALSMGWLAAGRQAALSSEVTSSGSLIMVAVEPLTIILSKLMVFDLQQCFLIENVYSSANRGKFDVLNTVLNRFGSTSRYHVFGHGNDVYNACELIAATGASAEFFRVTSVKDIYRLAHAVMNGAM